MAHLYAERRGWQPYRPLVTGPYGDLAGMADRGRGRVIVFADDTALTNRHLRAPEGRVVRPDGTLLTYQPYGKAGLLVADIDLEQATRLLATRSKTY